MFEKKNTGRTEKAASRVKKEDNHFISEPDEEDVEEKSPSIAAKAFISYNEPGFKKKKKPIRNSL